MAKLSDATKASATIVVDGTEWRLSPLEIRDWGEVERWLEVRPFEKARRKIHALGDVAIPELVKQILADAEVQSKAMALSGGDAGKTPEAVERALSSVEGMELLFWLSLRKEHPDITREETSALLTNDLTKDVQGLLDKVSGLDDDAEEDADRPTESE